MPDTSEEIGQRSGSLVNTQAGDISIDVDTNNDDPRSSEFQCLLKVQNFTKNRIRLASLRVLHPAGTRLQSVIDSSFESQMRDKLYNEMSEIISVVSVTTYRNFADRFGEVFRQFLSNTVDKYPMKKWIAYKILGLREANVLSNMSEAWYLSVRSSIEAERYFKDLADAHRSKNSQEHEISPMFLAKLEATKQLEQSIGNAYDPKSVVDIDPGTSFVQAFVFRCDRKLATTVSYNIVFNVACEVFDEQATSANRHMVKSITAVITPQPWAMNIVAVISAFWGWALSIAVAAHKELTSGNGNAPKVADVASLIPDGLGLLSALISAVFFYNIYDSTEFGRKINAGAGWRSALIIGGLCGLVNDKIVGTLEQLFR